MKDLTTFLIFTLFILGCILSLFFSIVALFDAHMEINKLNKIIIELELNQIIN